MSTINAIAYLPVCSIDCSRCPNKDHARWYRFFEDIDTFIDDLWRGKLVPSTVALCDECIARVFPLRCENCLAYLKPRGPFNFVVSVSHKSECQRK